MKSTTLACTPACAYDARKASIFFLPDWCVTCGRSSSGISASAAGRLSLRAFAPRLPPTTNMRSGPARSRKRTAGSTTSKISLRTGLPVTTALLAAPPKLAGKPKQMRCATGTSALFDNSSAASALTSTSGTPQARHQAARHGHVAPHAHHHVRLARADEIEARFERAQHLEGAVERVLQTLAAHAGEVDAVHRDAVLGHQLLFHAGGGTEPAHFPAARAHRLRDRQAGENMAAGAGRHDHQSFHSLPPRIRTRFS